MLIIDYLGIRNYFYFFAGENCIFYIILYLDGKSLINGAKLESRNSDQLFI